MERGIGPRGGMSRTATLRCKFKNMVRYANAFPNDPHFRSFANVFENEVQTEEHLAQEQGSTSAARCGPVDPDTGKLRVQLRVAGEELLVDEKNVEKISGDAATSEPMKWEIQNEEEKKLNPDAEDVTGFEENDVPFEEPLVGDRGEERIFQKAADDEPENNERVVEQVLDDECWDENETVVQHVLDNEEEAVQQVYSHEEIASVYSDEEVDGNDIAPFLKYNELRALPLFSNPHLTTQDHVLAFVAMSVRYNMSYENLLTILRWIDTTLVDSGLPTYKKALWETLSRDTSCIKQHWYCPLCRGKVGEDEEVQVRCHCGKCGLVGVKPAYFLQISLRSQLKELLSIPNIAQELEYRYTRFKEDDDTLEDIYDGFEYKKLCKPGKFLDNNLNFSFTLNTDGCSVANSSHASAWPVYLQVNELSPHARKKHMLLAGVWVDKVHPVTNVFLTPIVEELEDLYFCGVTWKPDGEIEVVSKFVTLICSVDSIARPLLLRMNQFNGDYGCTFCDTEGLRVVGRPGCKYYPVDQNFSLRTDEQLRIHMHKAIDDKKKVFGVQGITCLTALPDFDLCNGVVVDSMHNVFLGVVKQHTELLISNVNSPWYVGSPKQLSVIDERLLSIKPPTRISRRPRSIAIYHKQWKASEWRNWLLYYCLVCLEGLLPSYYLKHLALLVQAIHTMNKDSLTTRELQDSRQLLTEYVQQFQDYFGVEHMSFNLHLLLHLSDSVRNWGPLWATTAFTFESWNHRILKTVSSPNKRIDQIVTRFLMAKFINNIVYKNTVSVESKSFIAKLLGSVDYEDIEAREAPIFIGIGKRKVQVPTDWQRQSLTDKRYECAQLTLFTKAKIDGIEYRCNVANTSTSFSNSTVYSRSFGFSEIIDIVEFVHEGRNVHGVFLKQYRGLGDIFGSTYVQKVDITGHIGFVEVSDIRGPAISIETSNGTYAVKLPNCWESD